MKEHKTDETRERILRAASELFARDGFRKTSVRAICEKAGTNVAAVNYHFRSKEQLYIDVFRVLFEGLREPLLAMPDRIHDAASWRRALREWVEHTLRIATNDKPPDAWITQLVGHERADPTSAMPIVYKQFLDPLRLSIERIVRMGMPRGSTDLDVHLVVVSLTSQCTVYLHRKPPWGRLLIPPHVNREDWVSRTAEFIVEGITSRLSYRGGAGASLVEHKQTKGEKS